MNKTIHELDTLTQAEAQDEMIVYDVSDGTSKKVQVKNLVGNYSETETLTGGTWIDGKPIYRCVYSVNISVSSNTWTDTGISNADKQTIINAIGYSTTGTMYSFIGVSRDSGDYIQVVNARGLTLSKLMLEYTKP